MLAAMYEPKGMEPTTRAAESLRIGFEKLGIETTLPTPSNWNGIPQGADFIVVFGWRKRFLDGCKNYAYPRNRVIDDAQRRGIPALCVERGCFGMLSRANWHLLGWNGLNGRSSWLNGHLGDRWNRIFEPVVPVHPWIERNGPVVILGQVPRDAAIDSCPNYGKWLEDIRARLLSITPNVVFRPHPKATNVHLRLPIDHHRSLSETLKTAAATVAWNSTSGVESVTSGVPHYCADQGSMAYPVRESSLEALVRNPRRTDRLPWLRRLAYAQWTDNEIKSGEALEYVLSAGGLA